MSDKVKIVECPRDAWQGLPLQIPSHVKARYIKGLADCGFRHIDAVSFVSPAAVPQMADSEQVLEHLGPLPGVEIIGIAVNTKGAERAVRSGAVQTIGFPYSISPQFLQRNQHQTPEESLRELRLVSALATPAGIGVVAYISMAFGNPYNETWDIKRVTDSCELLLNCGVRQISLADTMGLAPAARVEETVRAVSAQVGDLDIGVHLHANPQDAADKIRAAYRAGCRRFDGAIGGLGGCPFAGDRLIGNVATETLIQVLRDEKAQLDRLAPLDGLILVNAEIAAKFGALVL